MNTMTQAHLEGSYVQMHRNQEGTTSIQKIPRNGSKRRRFTTHPLPQLYNLQGESRLNQQKSASHGGKQIGPERDARNLKIGGMQRDKKRVAKKTKTVKTERLKFE